MLDEPVRWDDSMNGWVVSTYDLVKEVLRGDDNLCRHMDFDNAEVVSGVIGNPRHMSFITGDEHRRMHQWWIKLFSPAQAARYQETVVKPIVTATFDRLVSRSDIDITADVATRIPPRVIAAVLGLPWEDDAWIARMVVLLRRVGTFFDRRPSQGEIEADATSAAKEVAETLMPFVRERASGEGDDAISFAWRELPKTLPDFSETDVIGVVQTMFLGGTDTTARGIANAAYLLLTRPDIAEQVRTDMSLEAPFVEESLRLLGPSHFRSRRANKDFEVGGVKIRKDDKVLPVLASADRDPAKYPQPDALNLHRPAARDHVAFNTGPRMCVGAALARAEIHEAVHQLLHRVPNLRINADAPAPEMEGFALRAYTPLHGKFDPVVG
jgi:cytochrome P450